MMLGVACEKLTLDLANTVQKALTGTEAENLLRRAAPVAGWRP